MFLTVPFQKAGLWQHFKCCHVFFTIILAPFLVLGLFLSLALPVSASPVMSVLQDARHVKTHFNRWQKRQSQRTKQTATNAGYEDSYRRTGSVAERALNAALNTVGDGMAYKWRSKRFNLQGSIRPTLTYKNAQGQVCRHLYFSLENLTFREKNQALACRNRAGKWAIKG